MKTCPAKINTLTILVLVLGASCSSAGRPSQDEDDQTPLVDQISLVYPGEASPELGDGPFLFGGETSEDACLELPCPQLQEDKVLCALTRYAGSIAIVEHVEAPETFDLEYPTCDGPYSSWGQAFEVKVLSVLTGEPLPENLRLVLLRRALYGEYPLVGDKRLVSIRESRGEWFVGADLAIYSGEVPPPGMERYPLPEILTQLSQKTTRTLMNFDPECIDLGYQSMTNSEWDRFTFDPEYWGDREASCFDRDAPHPEVEQSDDQCTDNFPCEP